MCGVHCRLGTNRPLASSEWQVLGQNAHRRALASEGLGPNWVAYSELMGMPLPTRPVSFVMLILEGGEGPGGGFMQATRAMLKLKVVSVVAPPYTIR